MRKYSQRRKSLVKVMGLENGGAKKAGGLPAFPSRNRKTVLRRAMTTEALRVWESS
jgi:hypothetical protein